MKKILLTIIAVLFLIPLYANEVKEMKVLSIGNSFSHDAFSYVPFLLKDIDPDINLTLSIAAIGGCTLEQHITYANSKENNYNYVKYTPETNKWNFYEGSRNLDACIQDEDWDIIILQQQSERSQRYSTYQPFLNDLIDYIYATVKKPVKLAWHLTPAYGHIGNEGIGMYKGIADAAQKVMADTPIEIVIPNGTAIQNMRGTKLSVIGDKGHLSGDNLHMQEGLPRQTEAYTTILCLLKLCGREYKSIYGNKTVCDAKWLTDEKRTWRTGNPTGAVEENLIIAQKCAIMAVKNPFAVSPIN